MDSKIQVTYCDLEKSLTEIVRSSEDSYWIIWLNITELVYQSMPKASADCLGSLADSKYATSECVAAVRDKTDIYQRIMKKYGLGERLDEWGYFWRNLVREEKPFRLKKLLGILNEYRQTILPYCNQFIAEWDKKYGCDGDCDLDNWNRVYRKHRAMIKKMQDNLLVVLDVLKVIREG